eukprot:5543934-Pyramimonas_sp.AAC.1
MCRWARWSRGSRPGSTAMSGRLSRPTCRISPSDGSGCCVAAMASCKGAAGTARVGILARRVRA